MLLGPLGRLLEGSGGFGAKLGLLEGFGAVRSHHRALRQVGASERGWDAVGVARRAACRPADGSRNHLFFVGIVGKVQDVSPMEILLRHCFCLLEVRQGRNVAAFIVDSVEQGKERRLVLGIVRRSVG